jgi:hypothetical protein
MLLVYLAVVYAGCVLGALLEIGRRLVLLDHEIQALERRVYRFTRSREVSQEVQQEYATDLMEMFELARTLDAFEHTVIPRAADHSELSSLNVRNLYEMLERSWDPVQAHCVDREGEEGGEEKEGEMRDEKLRRRNVVAVERDMGCADI